MRNLAEDFLKDYIQLNVGSLSLAANHNILQIVDVCQEIEKDSKLRQLGVCGIHGREEGGECVAPIFVLISKKIERLQC